MMFVVKFYVGWEESKREKKERREKRRVGGEVGHVSVRVFFVRYLLYGEFGNCAGVGYHGLTVPATQRLRRVTHAQRGSV